MRTSRHKQIRDALQAAEDGLTTSQLAGVLQAPYKSIQKTIPHVWGLYIDRWEPAGRGQYAAVWMCITVPDNIPHPTRRYAILGNKHGQ
jgi:hypothetical protein